MPTPTIWGTLLDQAALAARTAADCAMGGDTLLIDVETFK